MKSRIMDYIAKSIITLESKSSYSKKEAEELRSRITKLISVEDDITEEEIKEITEKLDKIVMGADESVVDNSKLLSFVSPKSIKLPKKVAVAMASFATLGAVTLAGINLTGCGSKEAETAIEQTVETNNDLETESIKIVTAEETVSENAVPEKVLDENLSFDPNSNDELVSRMADFIEDSWAKGIDVPVDKMMDYYMVMNLERIDPIDYARLGYSYKTSEDILNNYQYCANLYMDDLLTITKDTTVDYSLIVADKDSAASVNELQEKIALMNSEEVTSKDVHDYIYETYIEGTGQRQLQCNVGPNFQAYNFMFSYDELTNGKGLSKSENDILNEDRVALCSTEVVDGEKSKSDKAQEQTSIINQLTEKLDFARDYYMQDLTNVSDSEKKTGVELENEIISILKERNAELVPNPEYKPSYSVGTSKAGSSSDSSTIGVGGPSSNDPSVTYGKLPPEEEEDIRNSYNGKEEKKNNDGTPMEDEDAARKKAEEEAKKKAEEEAKRKAEEETKFEPTDPTIVDEYEEIEEDDYEESKDQPTGDDTTTEQPTEDDTEETVEYEYIDYTDNTVPSTEATEETVEYEYVDYTDNTVSSTETTEEKVEEQSYTTTTTSASTADLLKELYSYRDEILGMSSVTEENSKTK